MKFKELMTTRFTMGINTNISVFKALKECKTEQEVTALFNSHSEMHGSSWFLEKVSIKMKELKNEIKKVGSQV